MSVHGLTHTNDHEFNDVTILISYAHAHNSDGDGDGDRCKHEHNWLEQSRH